MHDGERAPRPSTPMPPAKRLTNRRGLLAAGAGGVAAAAMLTPATAQDSPLAGTWLATLVRENPPPGFPLIRFLFIFGPSGSLNAEGPPTLLEGSDRIFINAGQGGWRPLGGRRYALHYTSGAYEENGAFRYTIVVTAQMTLAAAGDAWSGSYRRTDLSPDGATIRVVGGTLSAALVPVE